MCRNNAYQGRGNWSVQPTCCFPGSAPHLGDVTCPPSVLVSLFGYPKTLYPEKTAGGFCFSKREGNTLNVYECKHTTMYWGENSGFLSPTCFWKSTKEALFRVEGSGDFREFKDWLKEAVDRQIRSEERFIQELKRVFELKPERDLKVDAIA